MGKIFVVTGSNKGIGKSIVKLLGQKLSDSTVIMTSRSKDLGLSALTELSKEGVKNTDYFPLDVTDKKSIQEFTNYIKDKYKKIDVLINNAGWASHGPEINEKIARDTIDTNYYGLYNVTTSLIPYLNQNGRVVNVTSTAGVITSSYSEDLQKKFLKDDIQVKEIDHLVETFISDVKNDVFVQKGWPKSTYRVSKAAANAVTRFFARDYKNDDRNLLFVCCCPGYVKTDMSNHMGIKAPDEGAETPVWLATCKSDEIKNGRFYRDLKELDFKN